MTEIQQQSLQVCKINWVRKVARVTIEGLQENGGELREEAGVQRSWTERLVRSRLQWAGHVERMPDDRLYRRERQSYASRAGGDEGGQC